MKGELLFPDEPLSWSKEQMMLGPKLDKKGLMRGIAEPQLVACYQQALKELQPDLVIADMMTAYAVIAADQLGIPVVIVNSLPYRMINDFTELYSPSNPKRQCASCCGCYCVCPIMIDFGIAMMKRKMIEPEWATVV